MLTFSPALGNYSFFRAGRDECPFVNLSMSESFNQNVTVCRETALEQYQKCSFSLIAVTERKIPLNWSLLWMSSTKKKLRLYFLCRSRKEKRWCLLQKPWLDDGGWVCLHVHSLHDKLHIICCVFVLMCMAVCVRVWSSVWQPSHTAESPDYVCVDSSPHQSSFWLQSCEVKHLCPPFQLQLSVITRTHTHTRCKDQKLSHYCNSSNKRMRRITGLKKSCTSLFNDMVRNPTAESCDL